jgi:hypothetical protein
MTCICGPVHDPEKHWWSGGTGGLVMEMIAEDSFREHEVGDWPDEILFIETGVRWFDTPRPFEGVLF